jgi:hypothetical protein
MYGSVETMNRYFISVWGVHGANAAKMAAEIVAIDNANKRLLDVA